MPKTRPFFHDRRVLLLLTINSFLAVVCIIVSLLPLAGSSGGVVISQYRSNLGLDGYKAGHLGDIASFSAFAVIVYIFQLITSVKLYDERKNFSLVVLGLTTITLIFALIVVNALLELR